METDEEITLKMRQICTHCGKQYVRKRSYEEHVIICKEIHQSKYIKSANEIEKIEESELPTRKEMYIMMKHILHQYDMQQKQIDKLKQKLYQKEKKLDIIRWLNLVVKEEENNPDNPEKRIIETTELMKNYTLSEFLFDKIIQTNNNMNNKANDNSSQITYIKILINDIFDDYKKRLNVQCVEEKENTVYMYCNSKKDKRWEIMSLKDIENHHRELHNILMRYFIYTWKKQHQKEINEDSAFHDNTYVPTMNKVINFNIGNKKMKQVLYEVLKRKLEEF